MKELWKLNPLFGKYKGRLAVGFLVTIIANLFSLAVPNFIGDALTVIEDANLGKIEAATANEKLWIFIGMILGTALLSAAFTFLMRQTIIVVSRHMEYDLKNIVYDQYQKLSLGFYKRNRTGDLMNRISEDVSKVRMYMGPALMYGLRTSILFLVTIPFMIYLNLELAVYVFIPLPILAVLIYKLSKAIHLRSTIVQEYLSRLSTSAQEAFSGISVIKAYNLAPTINADFATLSETSRDKALDLARIQAAFFPLMILLIGLSNLIVVYIGGMQYINNEIDEIGTLVKFLLYVNMLTWPVASVGWITNMVQQAEASMKRINEFLDEEPEVQNRPNYAAPVQGRITFDKVDFVYPDTGIQALKDVSFDLPAGKTLAILGKTGSGKSTILELIGRLYDVQDGTIAIDDHDIREHDLFRFRESIGYVPQDAFLFSESIEDNIRFGKSDATHDEVVAAAKNASVHKNITKLKNGYDTVLGERGITLSGGQKQRVSIARAIIGEPQILLFDDCLSAVDTETEERILNNLKALSSDTTTIIVSHRISSARHADLVIVLDEGCVVQQGTHDKLVHETGYYQELFQQQLTDGQP